MRTYIRRSSRVPYTRDQLLAAVERVRGGASLRSVSRDTGIPTRSIRRQKNEDPDRQPRRKNAVFTEEQETQLAEYIVGCSDSCSGLTGKEARKLAADFAHANGIRVPQSWSGAGLAGYDWLAGFQKRNKLSLLNPDVVPMANASGLNTKSEEHPPSSVSDTPAVVSDAPAVISEPPAVDSESPSVDTKPPAVSSEPSSVVSNSKSPTPVSESSVESFVGSASL